MAAARQRPAARHATGDRLKLHRRELRLDGREHTVLGLRPGTAARFSTNRYHDTWHVLGDDASVALLARLLWGLAYTRRPGTLVLLDRPFLDPNPFDAEPADPVVLVPSDATGFGAGPARALRTRLPLRGRPNGSVRWRPTASRRLWPTAGPGSRPTGGPGQDGTRPAAGSSAWAGCWCCGRRQPCCGCGR